MISLLLEKISQKKTQLFPLLFPNNRELSKVPVLSPQHTKDLQRQAFLGKMTRGFFHDLLSPLAALKLYTGHVQDSKKDNQYLSIITDIHNELCDFITTIQLNLKNPEITQKVCFYDLCVTASTLLKHKLNEKNIRITIFGDHQLNLNTKSLYIIQILTNGLSNAIDAFDKGYRLERKEVTLSYQKLDNRLIISIYDNGIGIPKTLQKDLFSLYTSTKKDGHGIGLITIKGIVEDILKGTIKLDSEEGKGTMLTVDLPINL